MESMDRRCCKVAYRGAARTRRTSRRFGFRSASSCRGVIAQMGWGSCDALAANGQLGVACSRSFLLGIVTLMRTACWRRAAATGGQDVRCWQRLCIRHLQDLEGDKAEVSIERAAARVSRCRWNLRAVLAKRTGNNESQSRVRSTRVATHRLRCRKVVGGGFTE